MTRAKPALLAAKVGRDVRYQPLTPEQFGVSLAKIFGEEVGAGIAALYTGSNSLPPDGAIVDLAEVFADLPVPLTPIPEWVEHQNWRKLDS